MFGIIAKIILRNRIALLAAVLLITIGMGYMASRVQLSYDFAQILPDNDPSLIQYQNFKKIFGQDGVVMVIGVEDPNFFTVKKYNDWYALSNEIKNTDGIEAVVSVAKLINIVRNDSAQKFDIVPIVTQPLQSQAELDSIKEFVMGMKFYEDFIFNKKTGAHLMAITFDKAKINTKSRIEIVKEIKRKAEVFANSHNLKLHYSGMPYIRSEITAKVAHELGLFLVLAIVVCAIILFLFFRSSVIVLFSLLVVFIGVVWSLGCVVLFQYKITILTGLIPSLIIVIGLPNCILFLNKYHTEYHRHHNKGLALSRMIRRVGFTTFLANVTTSIGFGVFYFTNSKLLVEFGLIAAVNVMATYLISLILIPIVFSFLPAPASKHTKHISAPRINTLTQFVIRLVKSHYRTVFVVVIVVCAISIFGITKMNVVGYVVDDLPKDDPIYADLQFFDKHFKGVLPFEMMIDTKQDKGVFDISFLRKVKKLEDLLKQYPEFSKPLAVSDGLRFSYQAFNYGNENAYILPASSLQLADMASYMGGNKGNKNMFKAFIDSSQSLTRVSVQMSDVGSRKMKTLLAELSPRVDSIFDKSKYNITYTGNSIIFLKGNDYLVRNLVESIVLAIILISIIMITLFMSVRMIAMSILPSLIPLIITAGIMGFMDIHLKPSTILIFSIAFGISSDQTIYFLTKYRHEMKNKYMTISRAVEITIRETGLSMIYSAVILFCGFMIFTASQFGGTKSLGILISITLLMAVCANLILLPSFLLALERKITTKAFLNDPLIEIFDEDDDIDQEELRSRKIETNESKI